MPSAIEEESGQARRDRLKELLAEAVDLPADQRPAFFEAKAGGDEGLRARLHQLAEAWDRATTILNTRQSGGAPAPSDEGRELVGTRIGPYLIDEVIGSGGFGFVYRAHQEAPVRREVALKVLRPGVGSRELLTRFDIERQALARLSHPSIARIYDAGAMPDGRPFFAMELVDGLPITEYCDRNRLRIEERIRLFIEVCRAVQHAHAKGVIHRDIKPSNIMVAESEGRALTKVIDFGIAKATDEPLTDLTVVTVARQMMGTPRYMSPEQASLDAGAVDTRSDVYSLGVVLYELLCGTTPITDDELRAAGLGQLGRVLGEGRFPRPSQRLEEAPSVVGENRSSSTDRVRAAVSGELDWIVMCSIDPDPERRYPTAFAMLRDLERYLADEPIEARRPSGWYLSVKFARRHRAAVAVAGVGLVALVIVLATLTGGLFVVRSQRNLAREAERDALRAQGNEARARADAEDVLDYFIEVFSAAQGDRLGHDVTVLEAVKTTAEGIDERFAERPRVAARIHNSAGNLFRVLGEIRLAERHHARAVEIMRGLDEPDLGTELIFIHDYAIVFDDLGEFDRFREMIEQAHARALRLLGPNHKATLMLSASLVGNIWVETERYDEAISALHRLIGQQTLDRETYLTSLGALGSAQSRTARLDEAKETFERIIGEGDPKRDLRHILAARNNLAGIHFQSGELEPALEQYLEIESVLANKFGEKSQRHLVVLNNIAAAQQELGLLDDAWATRDKADVLAQEILPVGHPVFARLLDGRAGLLAEMGRYEEAVQAFLEVRRLFEAAQGVPESMLRANASDLARVYRMMERPDEAAKWSVLADGEGGT